MALGYDSPLYLLPFDHRAIFARALLGIEGTVSPEAKERIRDCKAAIYEAFLLSLPLIPEGAILVDEEYGSKILLDAHTRGITTCLTIEKSGQEEFDFEYGDDFGAHAKRFNPTFLKALIRYNPEGDAELNARQRARLKRLSDFAHHEGYKLMIEPLVPPTQAQLMAVMKNKRRYDTELRPALMLAMMRELQESGIEADVWKLEGMERQGDYRQAVAVARNASHRSSVGVIILGRGEDEAHVAAWLRAGRGIPGVIGFAIGRTIFLEPLQQFVDAVISRDEAVRRIAAKFKEFHAIFVGNQ